VFDQIAAGWIDGDTRQTWFFGRQSKPDLASTFEIGSATEVFTGLLLAQAAYDGKVRMQTSLRDLLPKEFPIADAGLGAITLQQLATHQAALPAIPPNLLPANSDDPYADYHWRDLSALLANYRGPESANAAYSTLDAGLLGEMLGRSYGQPYADALHEKVLAPLGMEHTGFDDSLGLLSGHAGESAVAHWHFGVLAGAAGLRSSVGDLLSFLQQNLQPQGSKLRAALLLARQAQRATPQDVGLGWNIVEVDDSGQSWPLVWRASRTAGFATFLGFRTDRQQALVLLGNSDADLSPLGIAWLAQRQVPPLPELPPRPPEKIAWADYPGLYQVSGGREFVVRAGMRGLSAQFRGQLAQTLRPLGDDTFASDGLALAFVRHDGKVTGALGNFGGMHVEVQRLSEHAPDLTRTPIIVDTKALTELAGDYRLDNDTFVRIWAAGNALVLQWTGRAPIALTAFARDRFLDADDACELSFRRDDKGFVNAVVLTLAGTDRTAPRVLWTAPSTK
jgi:CubicO group peptidase (beta-lactamase class C family)